MLSHSSPSIRGWIALWWGSKASSDRKISLNLTPLRLQYWSETCITFLYIHSFNFHCTKLLPLNMLKRWNLVSYSQFQSGHRQLTRPQTSHLLFQTKVMPGQTLFFGISRHWREVIMNINMYSWLFIQLLLCCLWCPVERVSKQCTINGREQSQENIKSFSTTAWMPYSALRLI